MSDQSASRLPYIQRAVMCANPMARELFLIMEEKQSNLAVALNVATKEELLSLIDEIASDVCLIKTHIDIIQNFDIHLLLEMQEKAKKKRFLIFEDRKFSDIALTARQQYEEGIYKIASWAHLVSAHSFRGPEIIEALRGVGLPKGRGLVLIGDNSSHKPSQSQVRTAADLTASYNDFITGFVSATPLTNKPQFIHMAPTLTKDGINKSPEEVIAKDHCDIFIASQEIIETKSAKSTTQALRESGWQAYRSRLQKK